MANIDKLLLVMKKLRSKNGCPWDKEQTHDTLKRFMIEEVYEVIEAHSNNDFESFKDELGDLLLQVVFNAQIAEENGDFNFTDVVDAIYNKLITRHPHVFIGDAQKLKTATEVEEQWESIKLKTKKSVIEGVPKSMPSTLQALRITEKASRVGFDWPHYSDIINKIKEELAELEFALTANNKNEIEEELGDLFFAVSNLARKLDINPEIAHKKSIDKFILRFRKMEDLAKNDGLDFYSLNLDKQEEYWEKAKLMLK